MWKKWKESEFFRKMKQVRVNRAVYLSAVVILLSLAVVLAITATTNRANKDISDPPAVTTPDTPNDTPNDTSNPNDSQPTIKDETPPELSLPVSGKLIEKHSVDTQVFSPTLNEWRVHLGVDIATAENATVSAAAAGTVKAIWEDPLMGWCVALTHSGDCVTVYKNLAADMADGITAGATVAKGQLIGHIGDSAMTEIASEPHLHMEMTVKGLAVDPLEYFSEAVIKSLSEDTIYESELGK